MSLRLFSLFRGSIYQQCCPSYLGIKTRVNLYYQTINGKIQISYLSAIKKQSLYNSIKFVNQVQIISVVLLRTTFCEICPISVAFDSFSRISPLFTNFRGKRHEFFAYAALQLKFVTLTTKIGKKRRNS